jgi:hypothetical protein
VLYFKSCLNLCALLLIPIISFAKSCETRQFCAIGEECSCTITPSSAYDRSFYFVTYGVKSNSTYQCNLTSTPQALTILLDASGFPSDTVYTCNDNCPRFPINLNIETRDISSQPDMFSIKYFVPASDLPTQIMAICKKAI